MSCFKFSQLTPLKNECLIISSGFCNLSSGNGFKKLEINSLKESSYLFSSFVALISVAFNLRAFKRSPSSNCTGVCGNNPDGYREANLSPTYNSYKITPKIKEKVKSIQCFYLNQKI